MYTFTLSDYACQCQTFSWVLEFEKWQLKKKSKYHLSKSISVLVFIIWAKLVHLKSRLLSLHSSAFFLGCHECIYLWVNRDQYSLDLSTQKVGYLFHCTSTRDCSSLATVDDGACFTLVLEIESLMVLQKFPVWYIDLLWDQRPCRTDSTEILVFKRAKPGTLKRVWVGFMSTALKAPILCFMCQMSQRIAITGRIIDW